jgi:hypothetical protein
MFDWINTNIPGFWEGASVALGSLLVSCCVFLWRRFKRRRPEANAPSDKALAEISSSRGGISAVKTNPFEITIVKFSSAESARFDRVSALTFAELRDAKLSAPPFQRKDVAAAYDGFVVNWTGKFFSARKDDDDLVTVGLDFDDYSPSVWCRVRLSVYPEIKVLRTGTPIRALGRIKHMDETLQLDDVVLSFPNSSPRTADDQSTDMAETTELKDNAQ